MGLSREGAEHYTEVLSDVPAIVKTNIQADASTGLKILGFFGQSIADMQRSVEQDPVKFAVDATAARTDAKSFLMWMRQGLMDLPDESVRIGIGVFTRGHEGPEGDRVLIAVKKADGGRISGPGGPREDAIPAWLSNGEYVINAAAYSRNRDLVEAINADGYADGGPVTTIRGDVAYDKPSARAALNHARGEVDSYAEALGKAGSAAVAAYQKAHPDAAGGSSPDLAGGLSFARSQKGKPYAWGAVGPGGYDCSGFQSAIENVIEGKSVHRRRFATASFGPKSGAAGFVPGGGGAYSIGVIPALGKIPGHMAGTINGVNVESRGGDGVVIGSGARGANHSCSAVGTTSPGTPAVGRSVDQSRRPRRAVGPRPRSPSASP